MKLIILVLSLSFLFLHQTAFPQTYKWVDQKGTVHYTDDPSLIPERYQSQIQTQSAPAQEATPAPPRKASPSRDTSTSKEAKPSLPPPKDSLGRGEEYWRARRDEWKQKLDTAQSALENLRKKYNELTERHNASRGPEARYKLRTEREQVQQEMNQYKLQVEEARRMLEKTLPEEAALFKAKPEWVRP